MKFTLSVKPLQDAMDLCIISNNVSRFFQKSTVLELNVSGSELRINTQATSLLSEAIIMGSNDDNGTATGIVDNLLFRSLIDGIETSEITLDFNDNCVVIKSGRSNFNVPYVMSQEDGVSLKRPVSENLSQYNVTECHPGTWKYICDHQLYAVSLSAMYKAYTRVWIDPDRGVLTGDPKNSMFTYQPESDLDESCLVSSTIVNLLAMMQEGAKIYHVSDDDYVVTEDIDSIKFASQFTVEHEDPEDDEDGDIGTYEADMLFDMLLDDTQTEADVDVKKMSRNLGQASLFFSATRDVPIDVKASGQGIYMTNENVDCQISNDAVDPYEAKFIINDLKVLVSHLEEDTAKVAPIIKEDEVYGIRVKSGNLVAMLGCVDDSEEE